MTYLKKINLVVADMGYGHQRAAYPLMGLSGGEVITTNNYRGIPEWEKNFWINNLETYEKISRFKKIPVLGKAVFTTMDYFQRIKPFYPFRNLSGLTSQQRYFLKAIKRGLGKDLMDKLSANKLPLVTTFFVAAYMAEHYNYQGDIYCVICDADVSRAWAPIYPKSSRIKFFAPNERVKKRLMMYGVFAENILISGFPLPQENIGSNQEILRQDLSRRVAALDPRYVYRSKEEALLKKIAPACLIKESKHPPLSITFAVGGAGAQKEIGGVLINRLDSFLRDKKMSINLVAGSRPEVAAYFRQESEKLGLPAGAIKIIFHKDKIRYFKLFNNALRQTDILWTKPSELSFYSGLGLPIIMSDPIGSQEDFNREWLIAIGAGIDSLDPRFVDEWLPDMLDSGRLARAAVSGFLNAENSGAYNIEKIIKNK